VTPVHPARPPHRHTPRRQTVLLPVAGLVVLAACGLTLLAMSTAKVGLLAELVGIVAALVPVGSIVAALLWIDRWEPEPARMLWLAFGWGASVAAITALLVNNTAAAVGDALLGHGSGDKVSAIISAPLFEEGLKGVFVLGIMYFLRDEFDGVIDGVVYAGFVAAGFAFTENIYYFARVFVDSGFGDLSSGVIALFILRGVLSPFAHPLFTSMTGIGIGIAALTANRRLRVAAPILGYLGAAGLHSLWNFSTTVGTGSTFINLYFLIMVPIFAGMVFMVVWQRRREQRIVAAQLPEMALQRWIAASEVTLLASLQGRRRWRRAVRRKVGDQAARAVAEYQVAATELAFLRHRIAAGTAVGGSDDRHAVLLDALIAARQAAVDAPGALKAAGGVRRS
jgi:protease PrsW